MVASTLKTVTSSITRKALAPTAAKNVREAVHGMKIPVGTAGELKIIFFNHEIPVGELKAVPFSVKFDIDTLVMYGTWFIADMYGQPIEVKGAYHYCIKAFKCQMPAELIEVMTNGLMRYYTEKDRSRVYRGLKKYHEIEPWVTANRDTPLMRGLLAIRDARIRKFSSIEKYLAALQA